MNSNSRLIPISYYNPSQKIRLSAYADIIVYERDGRDLILRAVRFGGYPEMVRALSDALYAGGSIEAAVQNGTLHLLGQQKRYKRRLTHDGVYAEAALMALDDEQEVGNAEEEADAENKPRRCFIFCPSNDRDDLFRQVDRKTAVPLLPKFRDYVLGEMEARGMLKRLTVVSLRENPEAWVMRCLGDDSDVVSVVEDGLASGAIEIPNARKETNGFKGIETVTDYLNAFGVTVAKRIRSQFRPVFDPSSQPLSPDVLAVNDYIREHAGYSLYNAQLAVTEAVKRRLAEHKSALIVAECGTGKTKIGAAAMYAAQAGEKRKTFNVVLCPAHVAGKWVRELAETLPHTAGVIVNSCTELDNLYSLYEQGDRSVYAVISKERARDGYMKCPAVLWRDKEGAFLCPDCLRPIETVLSENGISYTCKAGQLFFRRENSKNRRCEKCGSMLWAPVVPNKRYNWVKLGGYGWVYRYKAAEHLKNVNGGKLSEQLAKIASEPNGYYPTVGACRRYPLSSYIKRKYRGRIDGVIIDELQDYNNDSGQGDAMAEIYSAAKRVIGMTATLINGYASGIFYLLYRIAPHLMVLDGKPYSSPGIFNAEYGVVENSYEETYTEYAANRRARKTNRRTRQLPGVSPLVYSRFLLEQTAFLSLRDMGCDLPSYEEIPIPLSMNEAVRSEYERIEGILRNVLKRDRAAAQRILSAYLNLLTVFPDQPYDQPKVLHPIDGSELVEPRNMGGFDTVAEKELTVLDIVRRKAAEGERALVYTSWTRTDSQQKLLKRLNAEGFSTEIMSEKVRPMERESWVTKQLALGMQVMIVNPTLIQTGLDLNAFTTLIFYSMGYKLFTLEQARKRSWRINQTAPKVEVYLLYYKNTMQHKALKLMATKLAAAGIIEGNLSDEGLAAMSDVQDMTSLMAKELMLGIKDSVEDVAAAFKKMAVINERSGASDTPAQSAAKENKTPEPAKSGKKKKDDNNQLSIFDFAA